MTTDPTSVQFPRRRCSLHTRPEPAPCGLFCLSSGDFNRENAAALHRALAAGTPAEPVLVHCGSGVRVCPLLALRAYWLQRARADDAIAIAARAGTTPILGGVRQIIAS